MCLIHFVPFVWSWFFSLHSSFISTFRVHNNIQSQAHRDMVRQASQLGYKSHLFNFLKEDKESIFGVGEASKQMRQNQRRGGDQVKSKNTHVLFGSALKQSFHGTGCSRSDARSMAGQSLDKATGTPLQEQEGRCTSSSAPLSPKFCTDTQRRQSRALNQVQWKWSLVKSHY